MTFVLVKEENSLSPEMPKLVKSSPIMLNQLKQFTYFWIGIQYKTADKNYVYISDNTSVTWTNWANGQPDRNGNCVARAWGQNDTWDDRPCNGRNPFVCSRNV